MLVYGDVRLPKDATPKGGNLRKAGSSPAVNSIPEHDLLTRPLICCSGIERALTILQVLRGAAASVDLLLRDPPRIRQELQSTQT